MLYKDDKVRINYDGKNKGIEAIVMNSSDRLTRRGVVTKYCVKPIVREGWTQPSPLWYQEKYLVLIEPKTDDSLIEWLNRKI